ARPVRPAEDAPDRPGRISEYFGINTFGIRQLRDKLTKSDYDRLVASVRQGKKLESDVAPAVAKAIKEWAISRGATHFTHWFQPQDGTPGEKPRLFTDATQRCPPDQTVYGGAAHSAGAPPRDFPIRRPSCALGGARLSGGDPRQSGVHCRMGRRSHALHPVRV